MQILIFGHSDSAGIMLPNVQDAWPWLIAKDLEVERAEPVTVTHKTVSPLRLGVVEFVGDTIASTEPDLVCVAVNPFWFAATTVNRRIRNRFGERPANLAHRVEAAFDRRTRGAGPLGARVNRIGRSLTRRTLGTAPLATMALVSTAYSQVLARLSQVEDLPVIVLAGNRLPQYTARNPRLRRQVEEFVSTMEAAANRHHFFWFDTDSTFGANDRAEQQFPDGVHRNLLGHRRFADMILPVIREACAVPAG